MIEKAIIFRTTEKATVLRVIEKKLFKNNRKKCFENNRKKEIA